MKDEMSIREWQKAFENGEFDTPDFKTQTHAGWYDWFCKDSSLAAKTKKMGNIIKQIKDSGKINIDKCYVFFKNNCPCVGPLYDDFRICDIENGNVIYTITIDDKREEFKYAVWGIDNNFNGAICGFDNSRNLVKWLNTPIESQVA